MFRKDKSFKKLEDLNIQFNSGGVGDCVAQMSSIKYMRDNAPNVRMHVWVPDYFVDFARKICPGVMIKSLTDAKTKYKEKMAGVQMHHPLNQHTSMGTHLVDIAFNLLVDKSVPMEHKNYLSLNTSTIDVKRFKLPDEYIVLTVGYTAAVREMLPAAANGIIDYCKGRNMPVVVLGNVASKVGMGGKPIKGNFKEEIKYGDTINLVNKTTLLEAGAIIAHSKCIVGLDNGLLHIAGTTEVPIVCAYTTVKKEHRMPIRHNEIGWNCYPIEPPETLECRGCQSNFIHVYFHDFRECYYGDYACVSQITSDKYIEQLEKILNEKTIP